MALTQGLPNLQKATEFSYHSETEYAYQKKSGILKKVIHPKIEK